jgi:hypothetical protein
MIFKGTAFHITDADVRITETVILNFLWPAVCAWESCVKQQSSTNQRAYRNMGTLPRLEFIRLQETAMKYLCLVYGEEKKIGAMTDDECMAYDQSLRDGGRCLASEALQPVQTATVVRVREGKVSIRDGPFAETKEVLAGFYLIDAADLNDAIQVASQMPPARVGSIEVRPVRELISTSGERRRI